MEGADVISAAESCRGLLEPALDQDWSVPVPDLDFTVASVLQHAAGAALWYSVDIWGEPDQTTDPFTIGSTPDAPNATILAGLRAAARTLAAVIDAAPSSTRGFHPFGSPDPDGFAAMACDEILVHGSDAGRALGLELLPEADLARRVLARLYPQHDVGDDPWRTLLWANGRIDLEGREPQPSWRWHVEPL